MGALASQALPQDMLDEMLSYLVDTPDGAVGVLDGCARDEWGRPTALIVAQGWFGRRRLRVPVDEIIQVDHESRRIVLSQGSAPLERKKNLLQRLVDRLEQLTAERDVPDSRPDDTQDGPVLCGVEEGAHVTTVIGVAAQLATRLAVPLVITHVTPADTPRRHLEEETKDAHLVIDALLSKHVSSVDIRRIVTSGEAATILKELALQENASFLVIGSASEKALWTRFGRNVSCRVATSAPCPVVIVPENVPAGWRIPDSHR